MLTTALSFYEAPVAKKLVQLATVVSYYDFALILFHEVKFHNRKNSYSLTRMLAVVRNGVRRLHRELVGQLNEVEDNCESTNVCGIMSVRLWNFKYGGS